MTSDAPSPAPVPGEPRQAKRGFISSYGTGRCCSALDCTTVLSIYNREHECSVHLGLRRLAGDAAYPAQASSRVRDDTA